MTATASQKSTSKRLVPEPQAKAPESSTLTSSIPARIPEEQKTLYREVLQVLEENHVPYAVAGAFALQQHTGICRDTKDLDVFLTSEHVPAALARLQEHGFECEIRDPVWLAKAHRGDFFVDLITGMSNAVITVDASWIERAYPATIVGVQTRVLAPEELLASKLFVTRRERFDGATFLVALALGFEPISPTSSTARKGNWIGTACWNWWENTGRFCFGR